MLREVLKKIALPCRDDGYEFIDYRRLNAIAGCLDEKWKMFWDGRLAKIFVRRDFNPSKPVVVVSSHVDMVANRCYADCNGEMWRGSFDNLITNAAVVSGMIRKTFDANVMVAFTGDEEEDSRGACEVVRVLNKKRIDNRMIIVTDVTEMGWKQGKHFTIENIFPVEGQHVANLLLKLLPVALEVDKSPKVIVETEFADETWEYDDRDQRCCAICLPCLGDMHSESGVAVRRRSAEVYAELLPRFANACTK